jgi:hypothetical protein
MGQVKGTAVVSTLRFLKERFGEDEAASVVSSLAPSERALVEQGALASTWYPMSLLLHLMQESRGRLGARSLTLLRDMGRASAEYGVTTVYRIFFKVGSPQFIISRAARVFGSYYDSGELRVLASRPGHAAVDLVGFQESTPEFCERILGWMERTMELSGARNLRANHVRCLHRGDDVCRFQGDWDQ